MNNISMLPTTEMLWAFNINGPIEIDAIVRAVNTCFKPAVMLASPNAIRYAGLESLLSLVKTAKRDAKAPIYLQLDHAYDENLILECARRGFDIVMVDASRMNLGDNIEYVKRITDQLKKINNKLLVESELGIIKEGRQQSDSDCKNYTDPKEIEQYILQCPIDYLAVSIGNSHGFIKPKPKINRERLIQISKKTRIPLVLHGGDWVSKSDLMFVIKHGVKKINIGPELRLQVGNTIRDSVLSGDFQVKDYRDTFSKINQLLYEIVLKKLEFIQLNCQ